jgi:predicted DNA-binding transcriptional regulator AlpA
MDNKQAASERTEIEHLLDLNDVRKVLSVSRATVLRLHRRGLLKGVKIGKCRRWRSSDVCRYIRHLPR